MLKTLLAAVAFAAAMLPHARPDEPVQQVWLTNPAGELLFDETGAAVFVEVAPTD